MLIPCEGRADGMLTERGEASGDVLSCRTLVRQETDSHAEERADVALDFGNLGNLDGFDLLNNVAEARRVFQPILLFVFEQRRIGEKVSRIGRGKHDRIAAAMVKDILYLANGTGFIFIDEAGGFSLESLCSEVLIEGEADVLMANLANMLSCSEEIGNVEDLSLIQVATIIGNYAIGSANNAIRANIQARPFIVATAPVSLLMGVSAIVSENDSRGSAIRPLAAGDFIVNAILGKGNLPRNVLGEKSFDVGKSGKVGCPMVLKATDVLDFDSFRNTGGNQKTFKPPTLAGEGQKPKGLFGLLEEFNGKIDVFLPPNVLILVGIGRLNAVNGIVHLSVAFCCLLCCSLLSTKVS